MVVIDSSSLILLAKTGILDITINNIKEKLVIPEEVYAECTAKKGIFDAQIIEKRVKEHAIIKKNVLNKALCDRTAKDFNLGKGEAEAIVLCIELKSGVIIDDRKAINACKILKIEFATVLGLTVQFYKKGIVTPAEAKSITKKIKKFGRYSSEIINQFEENLR